MPGLLRCLASGLLAAIFIHQRIMDLPHSAPPANTALGAMLRHVTGGDATHALNAANNGKHCSEDGTGRGVPIVAFNARQDTISDPHVSDALSSSSPQSSAIAFQQSQFGARTDDTHAILDSNNESRRHNGVVSSMRVRRLTVVECERLQGLPDNFTFIRDPRTRKRLEDDHYEYLHAHRLDLTRAELETYAKDGPRYRAIGNGMAVPVVSWILKRLDAELRKEKAQ